LTARRALFLGSLCVLVGLGLIAELRSYAGADSGFLLDEAGRVLRGARLYVDLVDMNPPLIVLLNMAAVLFARVLGVSDILGYRLLFGGLLLALFGLTAWLIRRVLPSELGLRHGMLLLIAFALFDLAGRDFGEREHLILALLVPYLLLATARTLRREIPTSAAIPIGILAGAGFALKPHFVLVWVLTEAYLRLSGAVPWRRLLPETVTVVAFLALHTIAVLVWAPGYLELVGLFAGPYTRFLYDPFWHVLVTGPGALLAVFALLAFAALRAQVRHPEVLTLIALGTLGCLIAGAAQQKGLSYHLYPGFALGAVLLGLVAWDVRTTPGNRVRALYRVLATGSFAALAVVTCVRTAAAAAAPGDESQREHFERLVRLVRARAAGESIYVMSYHIGSAYPLINYSGTRSASRFPQLWMLPAAYMDQLRGDRPLQFHEPEEMSPSERYMNRAVLEDLRDQRPALLVILKNARDLPRNGFRRLDYVAYFSRNPEIARILAGYQLVGDVGDHVVYERIPDGASRTAPPPGVTPGTQDVLPIRRGEGQPLRVGDPESLLAVLVFAAAATISALAGRGRAKRPAETSVQGM
jgi:hypothetical protein